MKRLLVKGARIRTLESGNARIEFSITRESETTSGEYTLWFETDADHARYACEDRADCVVVAVLAHALRFGFGEIVSSLPISEKTLLRSALSSHSAVVHCR